MFITADDFGLCKEINDAVCLLYDKSIINSTSFITNTDLFEESIAQLLSRPSLIVGIHLNLTNGKPVLPANQVKSLINKEGEFFGGRNYLVLFRILSGISKIGEIRKEWRAQILKARDAGVRITSLSSHGHMHVLPKLNDVIVDLLSEFEIPQIRLVFCARTFKEHLLKVCCKRLFEKIRQHDIRIDYPLQVLGISQSGFLTKQRLMDLLGRIAAENAELILHPSCGTNEYHKLWGYFGDAETRSLLDPEVQELARSMCHKT